MGVSGIGGAPGTNDIPEQIGDAAAPAEAGAPAEASVVRGASNVVPLTPARTKEIIADAVKLGDVGIRKHPTGMPLGIQFASIDVSRQLGAFGSVSFGHKATILVPEGPLVPNPKIKHDPNKAKEFYVQFGASTNTPAGFYGPFKIK